MENTTVLVEQYIFFPKKLHMMAKYLKIGEQESFSN